MSDFQTGDSPADRARHEAAAWVLRSDRGLSAVEQDEFMQWLAADPAHGAELARHRAHWKRLDQLVQWCPEHSARPNPDLLAPSPRDRLRRFAPASLALAAAAAVAVAFLVSKPDAPSPGTAAAPGAPVVSAAWPESQRVLPDGSVLELNRGAVVVPAFTAAERRVRLEAGEAHFSVVPDPGRPFIVTAGGIDVRAVGTAFNVRLDAAAIDVLVTEGRVEVNAAPAPGAASGTALAAAAGRPLIPLLEARQRAVIARTAEAPPPQIATLTSVEIERVLAWQHRMLNFSALPLAEIVAEFNRRNRVQLVLVGPELMQERLTVTFRSDNLDGFVHLLEVGFGVKAERRGDTEIVLRRETPPAPAETP